jgi:hypothetical protein
LVYDKKDGMRNFDFICVSGYGRSGSSAYVDLLSEFEYIDNPGKEFRIAKDPNGLLDLELSIVDNWEFIRHNTAINDFLEYCSMLGREDGVLKMVGKDFNNILDVNFIKESEKYIDRINDFMYYGDTMLNRYHLNALQSFKQRIRSKFGLGNAVPMYFAHPCKDKFLTETRQYLRSIFENYASNKNIYKIVLDQAIPPTNIKKTLKYFNNAKLIIVDRDPRDIYSVMVNEKKFLGADRFGDDSVDKYIAWHKAVRKKKKQDTDEKFIKNSVLRLNFEDLFFHYSETIKIIKEFLNIDFVHEKENIKFKRESINEHVGIWKNMPDQGIMLHIEKELSDYC